MFRNAQLQGLSTNRCPVISVARSVPSHNSQLSDRPQPTAYTFCPSAESLEPLSRPRSTGRQMGRTKSVNRTERASRISAISLACAFWPRPCWQVGGGDVMKSVLTHNQTPPTYRTDFTTLQNQSQKNAAGLHSAVQLRRIAWLFLRAVRH